MEKKAPWPSDWPKAAPPGGERYQNIRQMLGNLKLATVCQEALCPNIGECWQSGTATFMLMGDTCTRACRFCAVKTGNPGGTLDEREPVKVGQAIAKMGLDYVVLTSVDRDDLPDLGSGHFAQTVATIKHGNPKLLIETLTPDFNGVKPFIKKVVDTGVDVFAHNIETIERLTPLVRDRRSGYRQSLKTLETAKKCNPQVTCKSSIMLGLGESEREVRQSLQDLLNVGVEVVTLGQYLAPTARHKKFLPVKEYVSQKTFNTFCQLAQSMGFLYVASGPLVRSSYRAGEFFIKGVLKKRATNH